MLTCVDRVQLAVADRRAAATAFSRLLGAEVLHEDAVAPLAARRTTLAAGAARFELLEPDGSGPVDAHLRAAGGGLFAAGFATPSLAAMRERLVTRTRSFAQADDQLFLPAAATGGSGLPCVLSPAADVSGPGVVSRLYEVTNLVADAADACARYAELFALAPERFRPIESAAFGYRGTLTMFDPAERLDRIEVITPYDRAKTMGRYFTRRGACLYMCFVEAPDLRPIIARAEEHAAGAWSAAPEGAATETLFIHPQALCGLLLGVSRTTVAWTWSGSPERVAR